MAKIFGHPEEQDRVMFRQTNREGKSIIQFGIIWSVMGKTLNIIYKNSLDEPYITSRHRRDVQVVLRPRREKK